MPPSFDIIKRNINITEGNIELEKIFKGIKNKAEDLGYVFFEKEQSSGSKIRRGKDIQILTWIGR